MKKVNDAIERGAGWFAASAAGAVATVLFLFDLLFR